MNNDIKVEPSNKNYLDKLGILCSFLCMIHCFSVPAVIFFSPMIGSFFESELIHIFFFLTVFPLAFLSFWKQREESTTFVFAIIGIACLLSSLVIEAAHLGKSIEFILNFLGCSFLAYAHYSNIRRDSKTIDKRQINNMICLLVLCLLPLTSLAKNLSAHVHGHVHLDVATDKKQLLVLLKTPSDSLLGFEYKAKTKKEKSIVKAAKKDWEQDLLSFLGKDSLADCKVTQSDWQQKFEGKGHSNIVAEAYISCEKVTSGRNLEITFHQKYPKIENIRLQLLREDGTVVSKEFEKVFKVKL